MQRSRGSCFTVCIFSPEEMAGPRGISSLPVATRGSLSASILPPTLLQPQRVLLGGVGAMIGQSHHQHTGAVKRRYGFSSRIFKTVAACYRIDVEEESNVSYIGIISPSFCLTRSHLCIDTAVRDTKWSDTRQCRSPYHLLVSTKEESGEVHLS